MAQPGARSREGSDLFARPNSLRWPSENTAFVLTLVFLPTTLAIAELIVHEQITAQEGAFFIVLAMVYVTLVRGRLLGTSLRVHATQLPEVNAVADRCARLLRLPMPLVFIREDLFVCITGMGLGEPYSLAISSQYLPHFEEDELEFLIGSELGHIAAGHTRITSLFSASGRENPVVALIAGAWMRRTEYTADRIGLLCCGSLDAATRAIFKCSFHPLASRANYAAFADQRHELEADSGLRLGEWISETPYAVHRIRELKRFHESPLYAQWKAEFDQRRQAVAEGRLALPAPAPLKAKDVAFFQRGLAFVVDLILVATIVSGAKLLNVDVSSSDLKGGLFDDSTAWGHALDAWFGKDVSAAIAAFQSVGDFFFVLAYSAVLVAMTGRTFGMMIFGIRVVKNDLSRVTAGRAIWRYVVAALSAVTVIPLFFGLFSGRMLHDRFSGTRVVKGASA